MYHQFILFLCILHRTRSFSISDYLSQYGYLDQLETSATDIENALLRFQEFFSLPADGTLNNETYE